ncbi:hypothetical protein TWF281_007728 [Arthrobotrys megalospora]
MPSTKPSLLSLKSLISPPEPRWTLLPTSSPTSPSSSPFSEKHRPQWLIRLPSTFPSISDSDIYRKRLKGWKFPKIKINRVRTMFLRMVVGCVVITSVTMVFALTGMTAHTVGKLGEHLDSDAVWRGFPVMMGYYNGIFDLVPKELNIPENTGPNNAPKASSSINKRFLTRRSKPSDPGKPKDQKKPKKAPSPIPYHPYPNYSSLDLSYKSCESLVSNYTGVSTHIKAYKGVPRGMPDPAYGSYEALGLDDTVCFERRTRFGSYGWKDRDEIPKNVKDEGVLFDREWKVDWGKVQEKCGSMNRGRFIQPNDDEDDEKTTKEIGNKKARKAIVLRVWNTYPFTRFDYVGLRSLITELNVNTGGEYDVHLLMHVKDENLNIKDAVVARKVLKESIAEEFWGIVTLWSVGMMRGEYKELEAVGREWWEHDIYDAYRSVWLPQQWFSRMHPEYEYFWTLEMDAKYTGHWYHFFDKIDSFAREQPRRGLWARNARFYVPSVHGSYKQFTAMVEEQSLPEERIWGPVEGVDVNTEKTVKKMFEREEEDKEYSWGKGEDADLITLSPIFDPVNTTWVIKDDFTGYGNERPAGEKYNPFWTGPPRRGAVVAIYRFSRRLLETMEVENRRGRHMGVEMFPASVALQYGLKAVYAPHPVFMDRRWPGRYLESLWNGGKGGYFRRE